MGIEVVGKGRANGGIFGVGFLICVEVKNGNGGRGSKGEDEGLEATMTMRFVGCTMMRKNRVLFEKGDERVREEGDVVRSSGL